MNTTRQEYIEFSQLKLSHISIHGIVDSHASSATDDDPDFCRRHAKQLLPLEGTVELVRESIALASSNPSRPIIFNDGIRVRMLVTSLSKWNIHF